MLVINCNTFYLLFEGWKNIIVIIYDLFLKKLVIVVNSNDIYRVIKRIEKMTIQDLKNNRNEIIAKITELVGEENVKTVMNYMMKCYEHFDTIEELIKESIFYCFEFEVKEEKHALSALLGKIEQLEIENN